jgi:septum site-determining protein MinC
MGISIKGKNGRLEVAVDEQTPYSDIKTAITEKLSKNKDFFAGSEAKLVISGKDMTKAQRQELKRLLAMDYDIYDVSFSGALSAVDTQVEVKQAQPKEDSAGGSSAVNLISKNYFNAKSVFVSHTLRSGPRGECAGDVVVLGDVNIGAEVIAGGSVAVMGTLRGLVHAGATGRSDVVVAANALLPGQLRISGKIAVFPEGKVSPGAEIAEFRQGSVMVRPLKSQTRQNK